MQFSFTLLAAFASIVIADKHFSCTCFNGDSYNWRMTQPACDFYVTDRPADVTYLTDTGRCTSNSDGAGFIDGDSWKAACQKMATDGFACADGQGTCYAEIDAVDGSCD